ncbi:hypothetical protein [Marinobacterium iners]|uniref:hypothetical protein n=1 Tax=Marinobacterium iners TaxID=48076 RepID=UPI001114EA0A|nr:hypothetical protein [Marinobacterium iners]
MITLVAVTNMVLAGLPVKMGVVVVVSMALEAWMAFTIARAVGIKVNAVSDIWKYFGLFAGTVVGVASLVDVKGPFTADQLAVHEEKHCVPSSRYSHADYKWNHAWVLEDVMPLLCPVSYRHKSGAVIWVELDDVAREEIALQLGLDTPDNVEGLDLSNNESEGMIMKAKTASKNTNCTDRSTASYQVPMASDGSIFCPVLCARNNQYTVGVKGDEKRFSEYEEALDYLREMQVAKWRRPNQSGNWGIVSAVGWVVSQEDA